MVEREFRVFGQGFKADWFRELNTYRYFTGRGTPESPMGQPQEVKEQFHDTLQENGVAYLAPTDGGPTFMKERGSAYALAPPAGKRVYSVDWKGGELFRLSFGKPAGTKQEYRRAKFDNVLMWERLDDAAPAAGRYRAKQVISNEAYRSAFYRKQDGTERLRSASARLDELSDQKLEGLYASLTRLMNSDARPMRAKSGREINAFVLRNEEQGTLTYFNADSVAKLRHAVDAKLAERAERLITAPTLGIGEGAAQFQNRSQGILVGP